MPNRLDDLYVSGSLTASSIVLPVACVSDLQVVTGANINAAKLQHQHSPAQYLTTATAAASMGDRAILHIARNTGTILSFKAGARIKSPPNCGVSISLRKNGSIISISPIVLNDTHANYQCIECLGFTDTAVVAGDVLEAEVTAVTGSTQPTGVFVALTVNEAAE